jgi:AcrR family transcriptional regulator
MSGKGQEDPRVRRTHQLILNAFQELLAEKGFESLTVQEIADRATVNRATFYAHFEDKYRLLDSAFEEGFKNELHSKLPPDSEFSSMNLQLLIQTVCEFLLKLYARCAPSGRTQFDAGVGRQLKTQLYEFLLGWLEKSEPRRNNRELRATITSWAIYGAAMEWRERKRRESVQEFARRALPMILAGFEGQDGPGRKMLQRR